MRFIKKILLAFMLVISFVMVSRFGVNAEEIGSNQEIEISFSKVDEHHIIRYTMPANGYVRFYFQPVSSTGDDGAIKYQIKQNYRSYESNAVFYGKPQYSRYYYSFKKGAIIEIDINSNYYLFDWVNKCKIKTEFKSFKNFESEKNDTKKKADTIKLKKTYRGVMMLKEEDWFVFKAPKTKNYNIQYLVDELAECGIDAVVYDSSGKKLNYTFVRKEGGWIKSGKIKMKKGKKYYIKLYSDNTVLQSFYRIRIK